MPNSILYIIIAIYLIIGFTISVAIWEFGHWIFKHLTIGWL